MGLMCGHALGEPPGMREGPYRAPSSPPLTPLPTKWIPFSCKYWQRRYEGGREGEREGVSEGAREGGRDGGMEE